MQMQPFRTLLFTAFLISLFAMNANSQQPIKNYLKEWKKVQELVDKRLPQSALAEVKKIYALAKKEKQDAQVIKSLVYMTGLQDETREENEILSIREIEAEIRAHKEPAAALLKSLLAGMYQGFFEENRWEMYDRTQTVNFVKGDISTWVPEDFHKKISELYLQSIKEEKLLQQTRIEPYEAIVIKGNTRHLRPTLFDLLANRAIDYFETDERDIQKPAYAFQIDQASAFDPAADFVTRKFTTRDSLSLQHKALLLYQRLIAFHLKDTKPDALIDADIQRIAFVRNKSVHPDKDKLYFTALNHLAGQYENHPAAAQAWYLIAAWYNNKAATFKPHGDTAHRFDRIKAKVILEKILQQKDSSEGRVNAFNLLKSINSPSLQFSVEKVNLPGQPFRALIKYRNIPTIHFRLIKPDNGLKKLLENQHDEKYWSSILAANPLKSWDQSLPATNDLQQHSVEVKIDPQVVGEYLLVGSSNKDFYGKNTILGARLFYVSAISFVSNQNDYFVLDRDSGDPLPKAAVQVWEQKYDYQTSKYVTQKAKAYTTDDNGLFRMGNPNTGDGRYSSYSYLLDITYNGDRLFMNDVLHENYYYRDNTGNQPRTINSVFLFTDRGLYRPGQTVFFKGIVLQKENNNKNSVVLPAYSTTVLLRDANGQDVDSIKVNTNEYGSFSGKLQLPQAGLNGQFTLYTRKDGGNTWFHVEEYKRPKFYVDYETVKGTYKVNDKIKVTGIAKAYAGNNIDGAMVKYRVVRQPRFLYPWLFWRWWQPPTEPMEITQGEIKTDKDGKFIVEFTAIPDLSIDRKFEPVFDYRIYADVTDINGETRSGEQIVSVGYKSLILRTNIPDKLPSDSLKKIYIRTENMNGEFEPSTIKVTITGLQEEKRLIRSRFWERPDQFVMSKVEYIGHFPYDEYDNESDPRAWAKGIQIYGKTDSARVSGEWRVVEGKLLPGFYIIEISTKDKNGEEVKDVKYIELFDPKGDKLVFPKYLWTGTRQTTVEPGKIAKVEIGTAIDNLFVVQQINKSSEQAVPGNYAFLRLNKERRTFNFLASEADRGGYGVSWVFVRHNRFYQQNETIRIPWTNKELKIEYSTFRDKILPGSQEKWTLKISGKKNEKVAAEMLAGMYDASLDQFYSFGWSQPSVWPEFSGYRAWNGAPNFTSIESRQKYSGDQPSKNLDKRYDRLIFDNEYGGWVLHRRLAKPTMIEGKVEGDLEMANARLQEVTVSAQGVAKKKDADGVTDQFDEPSKAGKPGGQVQVRKNFNETAFFFPELRTDSSGAVEFSFTIPEALTKWKFMALAHTKEAAFGVSYNEVVTQKPLMVQPNPPRFLREGDKMELNSKIVNLSEKEVTGTAELQLIDAATNQPVDGWFKNVIPNQYFTVAAGQSEALKFPIEVPYQFNKALVWRIVAKAGDFSDGEENMLPVLTNRMLVTEALPLPMRGTGTKNFKFEKLVNAQGSESLKHHALTIEYTSNPAWYAVQALPYLMEYPYDCAEQVWNRYYANSLATFIANSSPRIKQVFEKWKIKDTAALMSNLQKNQELKAVLLEETPWVLQAKTEAEQKRNIALLFDMIKMSQQLSASYEKLKQMQSSNGGFVWFAGGPDDRYITQYIVTGIGHLKKLKAYAGGQDDRMRSILSTAIPYLDRKIKEDYDDLIKYKTDLKKYTPGHAVIQYMYMRSFFPEQPIPVASQTAYNYFRGRMQQTWTTQSKYMQGMSALALYRTDDKGTPAAILKSLKETSIVHEELGMYWKDQPVSWWWHEAPIERHALLIEAFQEAGKDTKTVDDLRTWLLKNKQTNDWRTTKATAEACYALLLQGTQWLTTEPVVEIKLGSITVSSNDNKQEAGTGYFKKTIDGQQVNSNMGNIAVTISSAPSSSVSTTWGAVYWQYFEDLDKITTASTPLKLVKKLFVEKNTDRGPLLTPVNDGDILKIGDKIKVRVELRVDRDMEYVHMKDMRASALEPVNVLSSYKWQGGLGYYESTKDASTNFFFSYLRKGTYVFEYPLFVTHTGNFSNGITTIQSMYAPEFSSHSEGVRINVE